MKSINIQRKKGDAGEAFFRNWMNKHNIVYFPIDQSIKTHSKGLRDVVKSKRPDFVLFIPSSGVLLADVKNYVLSQKDGVSGYYISDWEILSYQNLENDFTSKVWFIFCNVNGNDVEWYWISVRDAQKCGPPERSFINIKGKSRFIGTKFFLPLAKCERIVDGDDLDVIISRVVLGKNK